MNVEQINAVQQVLEAYEVYRNNDDIDSLDEAMFALREALEDQPACIDDREAQEQARIIGMGAERELALLGEIEQLKRKALAEQPEVKTSREYPPLPEDGVKDSFGALYTATQMQAYVDADRAARKITAVVEQKDVQDAVRYRWLREHGFQIANVDLGTDLDGGNYVSYRITFSIPEPAHSKFEDDEWEAKDIDAAIDAACLQV